MILTVTLNPLLERRISFQKINFGSENRNGTLVLQAGGKGINVSRQLLKLGLNSMALTFTGGGSGKLFRECLKNEKINFAEIQTKSEIRSADVVIEASTKIISTFFTNNSEVTTEEKNLFLSKMEKMISNCEIVIFSGSSPCKETDSIFPSGIEIANKLDKISICDTYGSHLNNCFEAGPTIVHNNIIETEESLKMNLSSEKNKSEYLDKLYSVGIKQVYLTDGDKPFYSSNFDFHYKAILPKITAVDPTGSGDSFVAGLAYGWHKKIPFKEQLTFATALGVCNAESYETSAVGFEDVKKMLNKIEIHEVGKKTKIIDDAPN
jgi:1-phosphofructokinase family hexose kinase